MNSESTRHLSHLAARRNRRPHGFTLVETLVVLTVIAVVIAIGVPAVSRVLQTSHVRNAQGVAFVAKSAVTHFLSKPNSPGTLPVTEGAAAVLVSQYTGTGTPTAAAVSAAATLDNVLLSELFLERPLTVRMGVQNSATSGSANGFAWSPVTQTFTGTASPTLSYAAMTRLECAISDGTNNPGVTGQTAGSAACAFNLAGTGTLTPAGSRVAYLLIKNAPAAEAYQLSLDVNGPALTQNTTAAPATVDQTQGAVAYAKDSTGTGFVDVFYYVTNL